MLVETQTYRYFGHSKSDRNLYRTKDEIEEWRSTRDPIMRYRNHLLENGVLTQEQAEEIDQEALKVIEAAVAFAELIP